MGGAIITVTGQSKKEVARKMKEKVEEARHMGLVEELRSPIKLDQGVYRAVLKVHS